MTDRLAALCPRCGKGFEVDASLAGRLGRCNACGMTFPLPASEPAAPAPPPAEDAWAAASDDAWASAAVAPRSPQRRPSLRARAGALYERFEQTPAYKAALVAVIVLSVGVIAYGKWARWQRANRAATAVGERIAGPAVSPTSDPPPLSPAAEVLGSPKPPPAEFPPPPAMRWAREGSYAVGRAAVKGRRARGTDVRLFLPPGRHPDASLPCVFVCPAGSNLLIGVPFGDDEHVDFLPLLDRGLAVCFYTLDGTVTDPSNVPELVLALAMQQYAASEGGLHNLSDAIDTALAGSKAIDPQRLGVCGHSSAGTIAVMAVGREPRVAAGAVMAPAIDLPKRFGEEVLDALPGESVRLAHSGSPSSLERIDRPLLIVHARDDENAPAGEAQAFAAKHPGNVTLRLIDSGGHAGAYHEGLVPSFDFLAKALRAE